MASFHPQINKKILVAFSTFFNDIRYPQYTDLTDKSVTVDKRVPLSISTTKKIVRDYNNQVRNKKYNITLPRLGINISSMDPEEERALFPNSEISSKDKLQKIYTPVPYVYTIELGIVANKTSELLLIVEQIVSRFNNTRYFPLKEIAFEDGSFITHDIPYTLTSNSVELSEEISAADKEIFKTTLMFTVKANVYQSFIDDFDNPTNGIPFANETGIIKNIDITFENEWGKVFEQLSIIDDGTTVTKEMIGFV